MKTYLVFLVSFLTAAPVFAKVLLDCQDMGDRGVTGIQSVQLIQDDQTQALSVVQNGTRIASPAFLDFFSLADSGYYDRIVMSRRSVCASQGCTKTNHYWEMGYYDKRDFNPQETSDNFRGWTSPNCTGPLVGIWE